MTRFRNTLIGLCTAAISLMASAQSTNEHKDHHPAASPSQKSSPVPMESNMMGEMDQHMKVMQAMHEKMVAAKTAEDRQALMAEHMKLMQDGMAMMQKMDGMPVGKANRATMADCQPMMGKRIDMMESMMQMMMDRMQSAPAK